MTIVVDANILLSAIINPHGFIARLLFSNYKNIDFVIPEFAIQEISLHKTRICKESEIEISLFENLLGGFLSNILIFSHDLVDINSAEEAKKLATGIDLKDSIYISFSLALDCLFWTGDLKLHKGLRRKGFQNVITTTELKRIITGLN